MGAVSVEIQLRPAGPRRGFHPLKAGSSSTTAFVAESYTRNVAVDAPGISTATYRP